MSPKNPAAVALGRKGGKATAKNRTPEQRSQAARKAVQARWVKTLSDLEAKQKKKIQD
jgi:general stress protein YciG